MMEYPNMSKLKKEIMSDMNMPMTQAEMMQERQLDIPSGMEMPTQQQLQEMKLQQQMQLQPQQDDPFASEQYRKVALPDQPLNYGGGMAETLLNNAEVPKSILEKNWQWFHKDNVLTFLDSTRKASKLLNFDIWKIDELNCMPYYDYTFDKEMEYGVLRNMFETKLDRALGIHSTNAKNERTVLQSQFTEQKMVQENSEGQKIKSGFIQRLLSRS